MKVKTNRPEFLFIVLLLVIFYFIFVIWKDIMELGSLDREKSALLKSLAKETIERRELEAQAQSLNRPGQLELMARQRLGMIKRGETPFKIIYVR